MILESTSSDVKRSESTGLDHKFSIDQNNKAFEILSSGIYKNSIKAIVRELGTNASDSHIMAGRSSIPFTVHLPTALEPWFSVNDTGTGLSPEKISETYTVYFASDKVHSNAYTGCLGLGSKSPFSYTDNFTVTSCFDGMKRVYLLFVENGTPALNMVSETVTDQVNGVEVKVPVKQTDFGRFHTEAVAVYAFFTPRPIVPGITESEYGVRSIIMKDDAYDIAETDVHQYNGSARILMGNVAYLIDSSETGGLSARQQSFIRSFNSILNVNVGDYDITASRESLKYTPRTVKNLNALFLAAGEKLQTFVENSIAAETTPYRARVALYKLVRSKRGMERFFDGHDFLWNGEKISTELAVPRDEVVCTEYVIGPAGRKKKVRIVPKKHVRSITADSTNVFFVKDAKASYKKRLTTFMNEIRERLHVQDDKRKVDDKNNGVSTNTPSISVFLFEDVSGMYEVGGAASKYVESQCIEIRRISELPVPYRARRWSSQKKTTKILHLLHGDFGPAYSWTDAEVDLDAGGVYVEVSGYGWSAGDLGIANPPKRLRQIIHDTCEFYSPSRLVGVRTASLKLFQDNPRWVRLDESIKQHCLANPEMMLTTAKKLLFREITAESKIYGGLAWVDVKLLKPSSKFRKMFEAINSIHVSERILAADSCNTARSLVGLPLPELSKIQKKINDLHAEVAAKYPLFPIIFNKISYLFPDSKWVDYINIMDKQRTVKAAAPAVDPVSPEPSGDEPANVEEEAELVA